MRLGESVCGVRVHLSRDELDAATSIGLVSDDPRVRISTGRIAGSIVIAIAVIVCASGCSHKGVNEGSRAQGWVTSTSTGSESSNDPIGSSTVPPEAAPTETTAPVGGLDSVDGSVASRMAASVDPCLGSPIVGVGASRQLVTVLVSSNATTIATLETWEQDEGCWHPMLGPVDARVGYSGTSTDKHEGDGATPVGVFGLGTQILGVGAPLDVRGTYRHVQCGDWWDADPSSPTYNTLVSVPCGTSPRFGGGSEALWEETFLYRHFTVIEYNTAPIVAGRGSAIFLHVSNGGPTAGCVSLDGGLLDQLLSWLDPVDQPLIAIGTAPQIGWTGQG